MAKYVRKGSFDPIHVRIRLLKDGSRSVYLAYTVEGKRVLECLHMYLLKGRSDEVKKHNKFIMNAVANIKSQRLMNFAYCREIDHGVQESKLYLSDWIDRYKDRRIGKGARGVDIMYGQLKDRLARFSPKARIWEVNIQFVHDFIKHLQGYTSEKTHRPYSKKTISDTIMALGVVMKAAVRAEIAVKNPVDDIDPHFLESGEAECMYLTTEEIRKLDAAECTNPRLKTLYFWGLWTGMRISDIRSLKWKDIVKEDDVLMVKKQMVKTRRSLYLPLNKNAQALLPKRGKPDSLVFDVPTTWALNKALERWRKRAGIDKHLSFHTSRHSFATEILTQGGDLYSVSSLLGHKQLETTQRYAEIIDPVKEDAVMQIDNLFPDFLDKEFNNDGIVESNKAESKNEDGQINYEQQ